MKETMKKKLVECKVYTAFDGKEFPDRESCIRHEKHVSETDFLNLPIFFFKLSSICSEADDDRSYCVVPVRDSRDADIINRYLQLHNPDDYDHIAGKYTGSYMLFYNYDGNSYWFMDCTLDDVVEEIVTNAKAMLELKDNFMQKIKKEAAENNENA